MRTCSSCATSHPDGTVFCPDCGASLVPGQEELGTAATGLDFGVAATAYGPAAVRDTADDKGAAPTTVDPQPGEAPGGKAAARPTRPSGEPDALVGQTVGGVYKVIERIGVGGMGVVYRVEHTNLRKQFALKVLGQVAADHPDAVERFKQEAVSASRIEHDNIVDIITLDATDDGYLFIVMELLKGESLAEALRKGAMKPARAMPILYQLCSALHAAHQAGIIHRDMKPENVFLTKKGDVEFVKILDFGISKIHDAETERVRITKTGHVLGTPLYMSPEQAKGVSDLDRRVDVYSTGVILYEMLSGEPPFEGDNYFQLIWKHSNEVPPDMKGDAPAALKRVVMKALEKEPRNRWGSMVELEDAVAAAVPAVPRPSFLLDARTSHARESLLPPDRLSELPERPRRTALLVAGAVALVLAAGTITGLALRGTGERDATAGVVTGPRDAAPAARETGPRPEKAPAGDAATEAAQPAKVRLLVTTEPSGAEVFLGAERLGESPIDLERPRSAAELELRVTKRGYLTVTRQVTLAADETIDLTLERARRPEGPTKGGTLPFKTDF